MTNPTNIAPDLAPLATPIADLHPLPGNPRRGDVAAVARSYKRFGQRKPVVALPDGTVIAGNHQLAAAQSLGWTHLAVVRVTDDDATAKAYALADNRTADLGTYDDTELLALIESVAEQDAALVLDAGYTPDDIAALEASTNGPQPLDDWGDAFDKVPDGDKPEHVTMSFSLHHTEADTIRAALAAAKPRADLTLNPNKNGAALALIVAEWAAK